MHAAWRATLEQAQPFRWSAVGDIEHHYLFPPDVCATGKHKQQAGRAAKFRAFEV